MGKVGYLGIVLIAAGQLGISATQAAPGCVESTPDSAFPTVALKELAAGLKQPVQVLVAPGDSARLFIVEQAGRVLILDGRGSRPEIFLDIRQQVDSGGEKGLLGLAFDPRYPETGRFYINYTASAPGGLHTRIARFTRLTATRADARSETVLLRIAQPYSNHNGGQVKFGPDGYLYIGMGDGGAANDPQGHGQNPTSLLGKLLRIDVNTRDPLHPYAVPPDNPFVGMKGYRPEIWALGLRNPWRFSFDSQGGDLYLADVGQDRVEEINLIRKGGNYGWNIMEGDICTPGVNATCTPAKYDPPLFTYKHPEGFSITGGYVYRGRAIPGLCGAYLYADYVTKRLWALRVTAGRVTAQAELLRMAHAVSSFGQDAVGEIYLADHGAGKVLKLVPSASGL